jgi:20S proteasome alpha/beta subunit
MQQNPLENEPDFRPPFRNFKRRKLMTVAIGVLCGDGIILASDSRTIDAVTGRVITDNAQKVFKIDFADNQSGVIAMAGSAALGDKIIEAIQDLAKSTKLNSSRAFADLVERVVEKTRMDAQKRVGDSPDALRQYFTDYDVSFVGAHWAKDKPYWFSVNLHGASSIPVRGNYVAMGGGAALADFILRGMPFGTMAFHPSLAAVIYAINEIKAHETSVGGPIQAGSIDAGQINTVEIIDSKYIQQNTNAVLECKAEIDAAWREKLDGVFLRVFSNWEGK